MTARVLAAAGALDLLLGDPEWFPHPVRWFGLLIRIGERHLRKVARGPRSELSAGVLLSSVVGWCGWRLGETPNAAVRIIFAWTTLAVRSLLNEAGAVVRALEGSDLELARRRLARVVGRDTAHLDKSEILRAVIETLAESACDGIVAPLFWLTVLGLPGGMAYKAINTLDSMIGHPEAPYRHFGRFAARLDDAANFVPARLTALFITTAAGRGWRVWHRDGHKHASPNAGQSEAAMAGALGVRLGGVNFYDSAPHVKPVLNENGRAATLADARRAMSLVVKVSAVALALALVCVASRRPR